MVSGACVSRLPPFSSNTGAHPHGGLHGCMRTCTNAIDYRATNGNIYKQDREYEDKNKNRKDGNDGYIDR